MHRNQVSSKNDEINNLFKIYHQNIRGIKGKINEFMLLLFTEAPYLICLREHPLKDYEIDVTPISNYKLGAKYSRKKLKNCGLVGTPPCQRIFLYSSLSRTIHLSLSSLVRQPFSGPQLAVVIKQATPTH